MMTDPDVILSEREGPGFKVFQNQAQILHRSAPQNDIIPRSGLGLFVILSEREGPGSGSQKKNQISRTLHSLDTTKGFIRNTEGF